MKIDVKQNAFERSLAAELSEMYREPWAKARKMKIAIPIPDCGSVRSGQLKSKKPMGLWAPSTAIMTLSSVLAMQAGAQELFPAATIGDLGCGDTLQQLLDGPLLQYSGPTRALYLYGCANFRERVLGLESDGMKLAARRILVEEPPKDRSAFLKTFEVYRAAALSLDPRMEPGELHLRDTAVACRQAATAIIGVEIAPRLTELTGLFRKHVTVDGECVWVMIPAHLSKARVSQVRSLSPEGSRIIIEYVDRARPYLLSLSSDTSDIEELWVSDEGQPLAAPGTIRAIRDCLARKVGAKVSNNMLRRAMASRDDVNEAEASAFLGHSPNSRVANDVYANWDYTAARRDLGRLMEEYDEED